MADNKYYTPEDYAPTFHFGTPEHPVVRSGENQLAQGPAEKLSVNANNDTGFTHPDLHRRIKENPDGSTELSEQEVADGVVSKHTTLSVHGKDSYRNVEVDYHAENYDFANAASLPPDEDEIP